MKYSSLIKDCYLDGLSYEVDVEKGKCQQRDYLSRISWYLGVVKNA